MNQIITKQKIFFIISFLIVCNFIFLQIFISKENKINFSNNYKIESYYKILKLQRQLKTDPNNIKVAHSLIRNYITHKFFKKAQDLVDDYIQKYPDNKLINFDKGRLYLEKSDFKNALKYFKKGYQLSFSYLLIGNKYLQNKDYNNAIFYYTKSYRLSYNEDKNSHFYFKAIYIFKSQLLANKEFDTQIIKEFFKYNHKKNLLAKYYLYDILKDIRDKKDIKSIEFKKKKFKKYLNMFSYYELDDIIVLLKKSNLEQKNKMINFISTIIKATDKQ